MVLFDMITETIPMPIGWIEKRAAELEGAQLFPFNGFEDMIRMTNEGKLWKFPINNEQGKQYVERSW